MKKGFTLIELLIVVAIIAILAAIAIPNFLQAQVRAKVSRVKADMRTLATGLESYFVDHNNYPHDYRSAPKPKDWPTGLFALSSPISYLSDSISRDPFSQAHDKTYGEYLFTYSCYVDGVANTRNFYSQDRTGPYKETSLSVDDGIPSVATWWGIMSNGPDGTLQWDEDSPYYSDDPNGRGYQYYVGCMGNEEQALAVQYDPTNGTTSGGNIYRVGGASSSPFYKAVMGAQ